MENLLKKAFLFLAAFQVSAASLFFNAALAEEPYQVDPVQSLCALTYETPEGTMIQCTGALVEAQVMIVPGQCFARGLEGISSSIQVGCGYTGAGGGISTGVRRPQQFRETFTVSGIRLNEDGQIRSGLDAGRDSALIRLDHPALEANPILMPLDARQFEEDFLVQSTISHGDLKIRDEVECRMTYFGGEAFQPTFTLKTEDYSPGFTLSGHLSRDLFTNPTLILRYFGERRSRAPALRLGSAFYCRSNSASSWKLLGLSTARNAGSETDVNTEFLTPTFSPQFISFWRGTLYRWMGPEPFVAR